MKTQNKNDAGMKWTTKKGKEISEAQALAMAIEVEKSDYMVESGEVIYVRPVGRPPLGIDGTSPQITFRVPIAMRIRAEKLAKSEGVSVSALARQALEEFISRAD